MDQSTVKVEVYVGAVSNTAKGDWYTLPMDSQKLDAKIASFNYGDAEYCITEANTELMLELKDYLNVHELNQYLKLIRVFEERGELELLLTAISFRNDNIEEAIDFLEEGNYAFYSNVTDETSLGEAVVMAGEFGHFLANPDAYEHSPEVKRMNARGLLDIKKVMEYLDFEAIGRDHVCNGCIIYPALKTAIRELRK